MKRTLHQRLVTALCATAIASAGVLTVAVAPAHAAPTTSSIVAIAQRELADNTRNYETGVNCSFYGGNVFGWPACGAAGWGGGTSAYSWCAAFAKYVWREGGVTSYMGEITGMAQSFKTYGQNHGTWHARGTYVPQPGDAVVFDWDHNPSDSSPIDHVGIVTSVSGSTLYTIEGNTSDAVHSRTYTSYASDSDIVGFTRAVGISSGPEGTASVYGVTPDGHLTYAAIDAATGNRTHGNVVASAVLPFTPQAMATLDFNTILITSTGGQLYRIDVITNNLSLSYTITASLGGGWTHDLLAYDGNGHLFGIAGGALRRYDITATKPTLANIVNNTLIGSGFTLTTLTATGNNWILGTTSAGTLRSYKITGANSWTGATLDSAGWGFSHLMSPGGGVYYGRMAAGSMYHYLDANPYDFNGSDIQYFNSDPVDTSGWTQTLLSTQPDTL